MSGKGPYRNVLVISDNPPQCVRFEETVRPVAEELGTRIGYACSPWTPAEHFRTLGGKPVEVVDLKDEARVSDILSHYDLVISMHCKQLFPPALVSGLKCINIHPGYNPENRGWYPQVFAIVNGGVIGATIHEIDLELDNGPIIARRLVEMLPTDTSLDVYERVLDAEMELLKENIRGILSGSYPVILPEHKGRLYLKKDFRNLCRIDLEETGTFGQFIDRLRALSHGRFDNAFFVDEKTGEKIFVRIMLTRED